MIQPVALVVVLAVLAPHHPRTVAAFCILFVLAWLGRFVWLLYSITKHPEP